MTLEQDINRLSRIAERITRSEITNTEAMKELVEMLIHIRNLIPEKAHHGWGIVEPWDERSDLEQP